MSAETGLDIGRRVKALRISEAIRSLGGGAHEARQFSDAEWVMAAKLSAQRTGRGFPKRGEQWHVSDVTRALVIEYLSRPDDSPRDCDVPPVNNRQ
jgi:hypothetical protein